MIPFVGIEALGQVWGLEAYFGAQRDSAHSRGLGKGQRFMQREGFWTNLKPGCCLQYFNRELAASAACVFPGSLSWGAALCTEGCLAASLASTRLSQ